eukprot:TRINITY_DN1449_c1_g1_i1.p1 TRINITY_DN1449_c1_g1~~TRINITY_DN1449_c1_g1_i1.p1  ORF type:complete len:121 (+),score=21.80 TRINITY_DN1449_c1_g1_i1:27-365(+)
MGNMPRHRAYGFQSDFNLEDLKSGAFNIQPQGQKIRANPAHVYEGFANYEGEVVTMPFGQHVQEDGSILVQVSHTNRGGIHASLIHAQVSGCPRVPLSTDLLPSVQEPRATS